MLPQKHHRSLYAAFDRFPTTKGASRHIAHVAQTLFRFCEDEGLLYVLGDASLPAYDRDRSIEIIRFTSASTNLLIRALEYGKQLSRILDHQSETLEICHFRDPWSGYPIIMQPGRNYMTVYEVNGLPSIELPFAFPGIGQNTLRKIRTIEELCWKEADVVITPSHAMKSNLMHLGVAQQKIEVVPNGAEIKTRSVPPEISKPYILYFGALQPWQGIDVLLRAFARLKDFTDLQLVICSATRHRTAKRYEALARKLEVADRVQWLYCLLDTELGSWIDHAIVSVAPLTECSRNLQQGCCPLKILESMGAGVPVIASDLPSTREIITDGVDGVLVRPDRPAELALAIRIALEYPDRIAFMGENARAKIRSQFSWDSSMSQLETLYARSLKEKTV